MPMYEYECRQCGAAFELRREMNQTDTDVACAVCGGKSVQRMLSLFAAVHKDGDSWSAAPASDMGGGCCSGGMCGCNISPN